MSNLTSESLVIPEKDIASAQLLPAVGERALLVDSNGDLYTVDSNGTQTPVSVPLTFSTLSDYQNIIVVDAGGNGDYTTLSAAISNASENSVIFCLSSGVESGNSIVNNEVTVVGCGQLIDLGNYSIQVNAPLNIYNLKLKSSGSVTINGNSSLATSINIDNTSSIENANISGYAIICEYRKLSIKRSKVFNSVGTNAIFLLSGINADTTLEYCEVLGDIGTDASWTNAKLYHNTIVGSLTNISVGSGNYSNTVNGVSWPSLLPYKSYVARINLANLVLTELTNNTGLTYVVSKQGTGSYRVTASSNFADVNKVFAMIGNHPNVFAGDFRTSAVGVASTNIIPIQTIDPINGLNSDVGNVTIPGVPFEIRIYS